MKDIFKKFFAGSPAQQAAEAAHTEEVTNMTTSTDQANLATDNPAVAELTANLASVTEAMATMQNSFNELTAKYEQGQTLLATMEADKVSLVEAAKAKTVASRTEKLTAVLGTEKTPSVLAALSGLDDATFATVLGTYAASYEAEAKSAMFTEAGISAETKVPEDEQDTAKRLESKFNKQFNSK